MSALGQLRTSPAEDGTSASPLKADIRASGQHVPKADIGRAGDAESPKRKVDEGGFLLVPLTDLRFSPHAKLARKDK
jgi:hypothetical protein